MIPGGLQKCSLIDYPGVVSCVIFTQGCNFRCPFCHNPSLVPSAAQETREHPSEKEVMAFLRGRKDLLSGVVLSGGEPTLHGDLMEFCRRIKEMGYFIKLDTNGSRPKMLAALMEKNLVDYVAMDIKTLPEHYGLYMKEGFDPRSILESIGVIMSSGRPYEFRTTCVKPMVDRHVVEGIGRLIENARLYVLQPFIPGEILRPDFFDVKKEKAYREDELHHFRAIAEKWVKNARVRI